MIMYNIKIHGEVHGRGKFTGNIIHLMEMTAAYKCEIFVVQSDLAFESQ